MRAPACVLVATPFQSPKGWSAKHSGFLVAASLGREGEGDERNEARRSDRCGEQAEHPAARIQQHEPILMSGRGICAPRKPVKACFTRTQACQTGATRAGRRGKEEAPRRGFRGLENF